MDRCNAKGWGWAAAWVLLAAASAPAAEQAPSLAEVIEGIRREATRSSSDPGGRPLPLAGHWNTGLGGTGFGPAEQRWMIEQGHYLFPWFAQPEPNQKKFDPDYYLPTLKWCAEHRLPIALISTQWERLLSVDERFTRLPADANPNVIDATGKMHRSVSPFGPIAPWRQVGSLWARSQFLRELQRTYPDPPLVLFLSNNEHSKLRWDKAETDRRFEKHLRKDASEDDRRRVFGDAWIERYAALHEGFRESLPPSWREGARFAGYNAFGPWFMGRWPGWRQYSLHVPGRISPWPFVWGGASVPYYTNDWEAITDFFVYSPQVQAMNWAPMFDDALQANSDFWFELSIWDGQKPGEKNDKKQFYAERKQTYTPERYAGMTQFGMWLLRPRVVREFRGYLETAEQFGDYFDVLMAAVDRVHNDPVLQEFWRAGELVTNPRHEHPYQSLVPDEYKDRARWFLLDTSVDPKRPWKLYTDIPVFALALVKGSAPNREWLVYAHSPVRNESGVEIDVPGYGAVTLDVEVGGVFRHIKETR